MLIVPVPFDDWPGCSLWSGPLDRALTSAQSAWLGSDERERARRFVHEVHRGRYIAAHAALRECLAVATGQAPGALDIVVDTNGKPALAGASALHFNISHSEDRLLIGLSHGAKLGVDIEVQRPVRDARALAHRYFVGSELDAVENAPDDAARDLAFLRVWTRKEACLKAIGLGLRVAPSSFEAGAAAGGALVRLPTPTGEATVEVCSVEGGPGVLAAVARLRP